MPDALALAAAYLSAGGRPPLYVADLAALYLAFEDHRRNGGPVPNVVLSPEMTKFFEKLEVKRSIEIEHRKETPR
jgi:hypothetical protein